MSCNTCAKQATGVLAAVGVPPNQSMGVYGQRAGGQTWQYLPRCPGCKKWVSPRHGVCNYEKCKRGGTQVVQATGWPPHQKMNFNKNRKSQELLSDTLVEAQSMCDAWVELRRAFYEAMSKDSNFGSLERQKGIEGIEAQLAWLDKTLQEVAKVFDQPRPDFSSLYAPDEPAQGGSRYQASLNEAVERLGILLKNLRDNFQTVLESDELILGGGEEQEFEAQMRLLSSSGCVDSIRMGLFHLRLVRNGLLVWG